MLARILAVTGLAVLVSISAPSKSYANQFLAQPERSTPASPHRKNTPQRLTPEGVLRLRAVLTALEGAGTQEKGLEMHESEAQEFYASFQYSLPWITDTVPTAQARQIIEELRHADGKGLRPEDYDGPLWDARLADFALSNTPSEEAAIQFDVALTVSTMRFLSDLHVGRVNPRALQFEITTDKKSLDLSEFLRHELVNASDVRAVLESVEPQFLAYRRTLQALHTYLELAHKDNGEILPLPAEAVHPGDAYAGVPRLVRLLQLLGDLGPSDRLNKTTYDRELIAAVKHFQRRHGLEPIGHIDSPTLAQLNTSLNRRVLQLQLTLERWRWLPQNFSRPPVVVNIPEFRLYAITVEHRVALAMNIVVGRAYRHETPVFMSEIQSVIFRPFWNVPLAIQRDELAPQLDSDPLYLAENSYEIVDARGRVVEDSESAAVLKDKLRNGEWLLRQRPGPENSLGLIKFELPNPYDVYLHGTPAQEMFARSRRDFSHGCIRVEDPAALAAWILRGNPEWTEERIRSAMNGNQTLRVRLEDPIPAWILYGTAVVQEDGEVRFFEDIYGHDGALERALEQRNFRSAR